jgi:hypothetical protein
VLSIGVEGGGNDGIGLTETIDGRAWRRGSDRLNMAGGERAVQREQSLKSVRPVFQAGFYPPAVRADPERYGP